MTFQFSEDVVGEKALPDPEPSRLAPHLPSLQGPLLGLGIQREVLRRHLATLLLAPDQFLQEAFPQVTAPH